MAVASGAVGLLPCRASAKTVQPKTDYDVVIIGAGIAGLAAARDLSNLGYEVLVLESRDRIGGRIFTDWSLEAPFEWGAGWIHGPNGNPISALAKTAKVKTYATDDDSLLVLDKTGTPVKDAALEALEERLYKVASAIEGGVETDMALSKAIDHLDPELLKDPLFHWALTAFTEFDTGGAIENLSAKYYMADAEFEGDDVIPVGGYDKVLKPLLTGFDLALNAPVSHVAYEAGDGASIAAGDQVYEADFVICTIPLGVLKKHATSFDPPLPKRLLTSIDRIAMGSVTKLALKFDAPFWDIKTQYFGVLTEKKGRWPYFVNYRTFSDENILLALSFGDYAIKADTMTDEEMVADAMDVLRNAFGAKIPAPRAFLATHWAQDRHTYGAYSYVSVGAKPSDFDAFSKPIGDVLIFAGEHTNFAYHATTHGAFLSGKRAAAAVDILSD